MPITLARSSSISQVRRIIIVLPKPARRAPSIIHCLFFTMEHHRPHNTRTRPSSPTAKLPKLGHPVQLLTIADRLYLAAYLDAPDENTLFPYPEPPRSPSKRSQKSASGPAPTPKRLRQPHYFTVDDTLLYNAFHHDFGPLHIGHLYRFALQFHEILGSKENKDRPVVFWSRADPRSMLCSSVHCYLC